MRDLNALFDSIDEANSHDPNLIDGEPRARLQGRAASAWLAKLEDEPSNELQLVVRAHHLRRWELARADFPEGRAGYLTWRKANKAHQADALAELMEADGWATESIDRCRALLQRTKLRTDPETQMLEDAACLVFIDTQFDEMASRLDHDHLVSVVAKTLKKMSAAAVTLASSIPLSKQANAVLHDAINLDEAPAS